MTDVNKDISMFLDEKVMKTFCVAKSFKDNDGGRVNSLHFSWNGLSLITSSEDDQIVIYDFRSKDIASGGHGAPLVALVDEALVGRLYGWRGVLNLGGIANLTIIPPKTGIDKTSQCLGWDCGPANSLVDLATGMGGFLEHAKKYFTEHKSFINYKLHLRKS